MFAFVIHKSQLLMKMVFFIQLMVGDTFVIHMSQIVVEGTFVILKSQLEQT